jgi:hypothetical protein
LHIFMHRGHGGHGDHVRHQPTDGRSRQPTGDQP